MSMAILLIRWTVCTELVVNNLLVADRAYMGLNNKYRIMGVR
jgi:hypothetical protein